MFGRFKVPLPRIIDFVLCAKLAKKIRLEVIVSDILRIKMPYSFLDRIQYIMKKYNVTQHSLGCKAEVELVVAVPRSRSAYFKETIIELLQGHGEIVNE